MTERPDLDGRDPATLTELDALATFYPAVAELVRERDALREQQAILADPAASLAELTELRAMQQRARAFLADNRMYGTHNVIQAILGESSC
jgi:hypothetical protein